MSFAHRALFRYFDDPCFCSSGMCLSAVFFCLHVSSGLGAGLFGPTVYLQLLWQWHFHLLFLGRGLYIVFLHDMLLRPTIFLSAVSTLCVGICVGTLALELVIAILEQPCPIWVGPLSCLTLVVVNSVQ